MFRSEIVEGALNEILWPLQNAFEQFNSYTTNKKKHMKKKINLENNRNQIEKNHYY